MSYHFEKGCDAAGLVQSVADLTRRPALAAGAAAKKIADAEMAAAAINCDFRVSFMTGGASLAIRCMTQSEACGPFSPSDIRRFTKPPKLVKRGASNADYLPGGYGRSLDP